jgi:hypothetical protein
MLGILSENNQKASSQEKAEHRVWMHPDNSQNNEVKAY